MIFLLFLLSTFGVVATNAQTNTNLLFVTAAPAGACQNRAQPRYLIPTGVIYTCQTNVWTALPTSAGALPAGPAGTVQLSNVSTFTDDPILRDIIPIGDTFTAFKFGTLPPPVLTSAVAAGVGTLALGLHRWCITTGNNGTVSSTGVGMNDGESLCSNIVSATVANQATQGKQTITWTGNIGTLYDTQLIYRSDGAGAFLFDTQIDGTMTSYTDAGDMLTAGESPPSIDGSSLLESTRNFSNFFGLEAPGGSGDLFWSGASCFQFNFSDAFDIHASGCNGMTNSKTGVYALVNEGGSGVWEFNSIQDDVLTASLPVQTNGSKVLVSSAIDLSGAQATGTLAAAREPAHTGDVTNSAGSLATTVAKVSAATTINTATNCNSSASPATCGSSAAGHVTIAAGATTVVVNTSALTAQSEVMVLPDSSLGTDLGVTCNALATITNFDPAITARVANTSFTISITGPVAVNPACFSYSIVN